MSDEESIEVLEMYYEYDYDDIMDYGANELLGMENDQLENEEDNAYLVLVVNNKKDLNETFQVFKTCAIAFSYL